MNVKEEAIDTARPQNGCADPRGLSTKAFYIQGNKTSIFIKLTLTPATMSGKGRSSLPQPNQTTCLFLVTETRSIAPDAPTPHPAEASWSHSFDPLLKELGTSLNLVAPCYAASFELRANYWKEKGGGGIRWCPSRRGYVNHIMLRPSSSCCVSLRVLFFFFFRASLRLDQWFHHLSVLLFACVSIRSRIA